jgi:L-lactate dehydrogenase complex protein LldF
LREAVRFTADRLRDAREKAAAEFDGWEATRERGRLIREETIASLSLHVERFRERCEAAGGKVHFAADAAAAAAIALEILRERGAKLAVKSKSMVTEEIGLNRALEEAGIETVETDLGEWIVQLARETPSHIILPAIHKTRREIRALFEAKTGNSIADDTRALAAAARAWLREKFLAADAGISGCNFAIAETGSLAIFTNEGNGRLVATLPPLHLVFLGMERIVPTWDELEVLACLLPRSATGQKLTTYLHVLTGPARPGEADGPRALHVIVLDNGRLRILREPEFRPILDCIRCGACLNVCPVYRQIGGHAYGSVYPGPIGAVLTPLLAPQDERSTELCEASSLCGACAEACPVGIPLHDMLVRLRERRRGSRIAAGAFARLVASPRCYALTTRFARRWVRAALRAPPALRTLLLHPLSGWLAQRELPPPPRRAFRDMWDEIR